MAAVCNTSVATRNLGLNAELDILNSGFIDIYDGTIPASADTAIGAQVKLATLTFGATAFAAAASASKTANAITNGTAVATSTATWARCFKSDHTTAVMDINVGTSATSMVLDNAAISTGMTVSCSSFVVSRAAS